MASPRLLDAAMTFLARLLCLPCLEGRETFRGSGNGKDQDGDDDAGRHDGGQLGSGCDVLQKFFLHGSSTY